MVEALETGVGNPSSLYRFGMGCGPAAEGCPGAGGLALQSGPVFFTPAAPRRTLGGGSSGPNGQAGRHVTTTAVEHHAILNPMKRLEEQG